MQTSLFSASFLATVSQGPGIYQMLGQKGILYVGKAKNLRKRLSQYAHYSTPDHATSKTAVMLSQVQRIETILTTTEKEALLLEASLIKKHQPKYNVILRDDKHYPLIKVTVHEEWPRILVTRRRVRDGSRYFGPYASAPALRETLHLLHSLFPLRRCRRVQQRSRPCLNYQLHRCLAPCANLASKPAYHAIVHEALLILEGKSRHLLNHLHAAMQQASDALDFEQAALYRDRIASLTATVERQSVAAQSDCNHDVWGIARREAAVGIAVLHVRSGLVSGARSFLIADPLGDDGRILREAMLQLYSDENPPPREVIVPAPIDDQHLVEERLIELRQGAFRLCVPQRGTKLRLVQMAEENAAAVVIAQGGASWASIAEALQRTLHLRRCPEVIECLDISNLAGKQPVASFTCFAQGEKAGERSARFRILCKEEPDDYAMMGEALRRRAVLWKEQANRPDMLIVDGGKGQLNVAAKVLADSSLFDQIDLCAIAKEKEGDEGEKLFLVGRKNPVLLPKHSPALLYLMRIRDEAHRFGITLHRSLRSQAALRSAIDTLPGIGPIRKQHLLKSLGSWQRVKSASVDELAAVPGISTKLAEAIYRHLHPASSPES
jgi:excinuclease ABC subunit C